MTTRSRKETIRFLPFLRGAARSAVWNRDKAGHPARRRRLGKRVLPSRETRLGGAARLLSCEPGYRGNRSNNTSKELIRGSEQGSRPLGRPISGYLQDGQGLAPYRDERRSPSALMNQTESEGHHLSCSKEREHESKGPFHHEGHKEKEKIASFLRALRG